MIDLRQMRQFVAVAEELSFRRAAERLNMSQPPLSQAIQRMEADIGAKLFHRSKRRVVLTRTGELLGTPAFMAPEQANGQTTDERTDVYGLGATLYAFLTGRPPFQGPPLQLLQGVLQRDPEPPSASRDGVPSSLEAVCLRCLAKDPAERYPNMRTVAEDLGRVAAGESLAFGAPRPRRRL